MTELVPAPAVHAAIVASGAVARTGYSAASSPLMTCRSKRAASAVVVKTRAITARLLPLTTSSQAIVVDPSAAIAICGWFAVPSVGIRSRAVNVRPSAEVA